MVYAPGQHVFWMNAVSVATCGSWEEGGLWSQTHQATFVFAFFNLGDNPVSGTSVFSCRNVMPCLQPLTQIRPAAVAQRDRHRRRVPFLFLCTLSAVPRIAARCHVKVQGGKEGRGVEAPMSPQSEKQRLPRTPRAGAPVIDQNWVTWPPRCWGGGNKIVMLK